jgi:hypothetical protein
MIIESNHGVVADLLACSLNGSKILKHPTVELNAIGMGEIGDRVMPKSGREHKGILPIPSGQPVVSVATNQAVAAISAKKEIIATSAIQSLSTISGPLQLLKRISPIISREQALHRALAIVLHFGSLLSSG